MEKLFEDSEFEFVRFTCDCKEHLLEVCVEKLENSSKGSLIEISNRFLDYNENSFWERIKYCFHYLFGTKSKRYNCFWGFILQEKDIQNLIDLLEKAK